MSFEKLYISLCEGLDYDIDGFITPEGRIIKLSGMEEHSEYAKKWLLKNGYDLKGSWHEDLLTYLKITNQVRFGAIDQSFMAMSLPKITNSQLMMLRRYAKTYQFFRFDIIQETGQQFLSGVGWKNFIKNLRK